MTGLYTREQLLAFGFHSVGENARVSVDARFFALNGSIGNDVRIDAFAILTGEIKLGDGVHVSPFCFLSGTGGGITMGDRSGVASHVGVFTVSDDYQQADRHAPKVSGPVSIGTDAIVGAGSVILPGVKIGDGCKIGCACVVSQDIPQGTRVVSRGIGLVPLS